MNIQSAGTSSAELAGNRRTPTDTAAGPPARNDAPRASQAEPVAGVARTLPAAGGNQAGTARSANDARATAQPQRDQVEVAVESLNEFVASVQRDLRFQVDDVTGQAIVQVIDSRSDTVVRQIPSELALQLARQVKEGGSSINLLTATS